MAHTHDVVDTGIHYKIDAVTRTVTNVAEAKRELVQGDHNSERITFEIPRYVDGHDFSVCNLVEIHYANLDNLNKVRTSDVYIVDDLHISEDDDSTVVLSWLISSNATQYVGTLNFSIRFACVDEDVVTYAWNTTIFDGITILEALNNSQAVIDSNPDAILALRKDLMAEIVEKNGTRVVNITTETGEDGTIYRADISFEEISQFYESHMNIVATLDSVHHYCLTSIDENSVMFTKCEGTEDSGPVVDTITINCDDTVSVMICEGRGRNENGIKIVPFTAYITDTTIFCTTTVPFAEIYQAYKDGMTLVATSGATVYYYLDYISETEVRFARGYNLSGGLTIDTITLTAQNIASASRTTPAATKVVVLTNTVVMDPTTGSPTLGYISPMAPSEIVKAVSNGQTVVARASVSNTTPIMYRSEIYTLTSVDQNSAVFSWCAAVDNEVRLATFTIDTNKSVTSKVITISSKASLPVPQLVKDDTVITEAGYYYAYVQENTHYGAVCRNFGVFYCDPAASTATIPPSPYAARLDIPGARLDVSTSGTLMFYTGNSTVISGSVITSYTPATAGTYRIYLAKLS